MEASRQTIAVRIDPHPPGRSRDALSEAFPSRLRELAGGLIADHFADELPDSDAILFTFEVVDVSLVVEIVVNLVQQEQLRGLDLRDCRIAVKRGDRFEVLFPAASEAPFP